MDNGRRHWLKGGGMALVGAGFLSRVDHVAAMQAAPSLTGLLKEQAKAGTSEALLLKPVPGEEGPPEPAKLDRLPLEWNKATVKRFKDKLTERDCQAFMVRDPLNITYLTGYWHTTTERPQACFMNRDDQAPWFFYPGLDRDSVTSWWFGGGRMYFDMLHGEGVEGHQPPYLALGDHTMLRRNMCFSEEPGLYDPEHGCGFNWSDTVVVGVKTGYRMSRVPYTKEWCWLKL